MVRKHIDQMIKTRNFRAGKKGLRQGYWSRLTKGAKPALRGKWENAFSGKQLDGVQEETLAVSATGVIVVKKAQSSSLAPKAQTQIDGRKALKGTGSTGESPSGRKGQQGPKNFFKGKCTNPSCDCWHPPLRQNYKSVLVCKYGDKCQFTHTEVDGRPRKKSKKGGEQGSVTLLKESFQLGCVSQLKTTQRKVYSTES